MVLNLTEIFETQKILDQAIQSKRGITYKKIRNELKLALFVELGELANEIRCFKFWSNKSASTIDVILEEYVDGIHFITSIANANKIHPVFVLQNNIVRSTNKQLTIIFIKLFKGIALLNHSAGVKK